MLIAIRDRAALVNSWLVIAPLIGIEDAGLADRARALLSAATQNPAVSVFDSRQDSLVGLPVDDRDQVQKPLPLGMYVMSAAHTWFG